MKKQLSDGGSSRDTYFTKLKFVLLGDSSVGKTSILHRLLTNDFYEEYVPTIIENQITQMKVDGKYAKLEIWDTAGQEEYAELRRLSYHLTDLFIIVISVVDTNSLKNALCNWLPDLQNNYKDPNVIFVGNKIDLREDEGVLEKRHIGKQEVETFIKGYNCNCSYFECSAKEKEGIENMFMQAARMCFGRRDEDLFNEGGIIRKGRRKGPGMLCCGQSEGENCRIF